MQVGEIAAGTSRDFIQSAKIFSFSCGNIGSRFR